MKSVISRTMGGLRLVPMVIAAMPIISTLPVNAQTQADNVEKMVKYAQCMRANGYAAFPDPSPDGRIRIQIDGKSRTQFEAAQRACKDKAPPGMAAQDQSVTPEEMQALLAFAACMRKNGVKEFPDPSPNGVFELTGAKPGDGPSQFQKTAESCRATHPVARISIHEKPQ